MRFRFVIFVACVVFGVTLGRCAHAETISWVLPTQYTDLSPISSANISTITVKLYKSLDHLTWGTPFATTPSGATSWTGPLSVAPGSTTYITGTATIPSEGIESEYAPYYTYTVAYIAPKAPTSITITRP